MLLVAEIRTRAEDALDPSILDTVLSMLVDVRTSDGELLVGEILLPFPALAGVALQSALDQSKGNNADERARTLVGA